MLFSLLYFTTILHIHAEVSDLFKSKTLKNKQETSKKQWLFKDYMKKFNVFTVWDNIKDKYKKDGKSFKLKDEVHNIMNKIDETDELLSLKIDKGDPKIVMMENSRRAFHNFDKYKVFRPKKENAQEPRDELWDPHYVRYRLNELMKQLIYTTRNKMVGMEIIRDEYRNTSLYKMGFLMSKVDEMIKNFVRYSFRSYKACTYRISGSSKRHQLIDILTTQERLLFKWFHIDLLTDLIKENDDNAREMMADANYTIGRKEKWKFVD